MLSLRNTSNKTDIDLDTIIHITEEIEDQVKKNKLTKRGTGIGKQGNTQEK